MTDQKSKKNEDIEIGDVLFYEKQNCNITVETITTNFKIVGVWHDKEGHAHKKLISLDKLKTI
jgi:hypothetical protein